MKKLFATPLIGVFFFAIFSALATTSCSFTNTIESIFDFTSSTTNWYFPGMLQKQRKIQVFSAANFSRLKEDMASGQGEYLSSLATLMEVPQEDRQHFFDLTKSHFHDLFPSEQTTSVEMLATLSMKLSQAKRGRTVG